MPAKSKSQQRLFGMLHAYNKGELKGSKSLMRRLSSMSKHISDEDATHFAKTQHKDLPEKAAAFTLNPFKLIEEIENRRKEIESTRRRKHIARSVGAILAGTTLSISAINMANSFLKHRKLMRLFKEDKDRKTLDEWRKEKLVPEELEVVSSKDDILRTLNRESDAQSSNLVSKFIRRLRNRASANAVLSGSNAFFIPGTAGASAIAVPSGPVVRSILAHEVGHYNASKRRKTAKEYGEEYMASMKRMINPSNILDPEKTKDSRGRMTTVGLETEAWDLAGGDRSKINNQIREAALDTYRNASRVNAWRIPALAALVAGAAASAYGNS